MSAHRTYGMGGVVGRPHVYVVDDDKAVRRAVAWLLRSAMFHVLEFASAEDFLRDTDPDAPGCILLDLSLPGLGGLELHRQLAARPYAMPVVFLSGQGSVATCAVAMKLGAADFLTKPVEGTLLIDAVQRAFERDRQGRDAHEQRLRTEQRLASLTPREREVLAQVIAGRLNKQIAADLGTAEKTVKVHRSRAMEKMQVHSVAELVRTVLRSHPQGLAQPPAWPLASSVATH